MKVVITKKALNELLDDVVTKASHVPEPIVVPEPEVPVQPINPNAGVEEADPIVDWPVDDPNFVPLNLHQLEGSVLKLLKNVKQDNVSEIYLKIQHVIASVGESTGLGSITGGADKVSDIAKTGSYGGMTNTPKVKAMGKSSTIESKNIDALRKLIREAMNEAGEIDDDDEKGWEEFDPKPYIEKHPGGMDYTDIVQVAKAEGLPSLNTASAARQTVEKALMKMRYMASLEPQEQDRLILKGIRAYIDAIEKKVPGLPSDQDLSTDEIQLLKDHPAIVVELSGFRAFFRKFVLASMRKDDIKGWDMYDKATGNVWSQEQTKQHIDDIRRGRKPRKNK